MTTPSINNGLGSKKVKLRCPECGKADMKVVKGWESPKALRCPKCGEYAYTVMGILCIKTVHFDDPNHEALSYDQVKESTI